jgi:ribosomal protein S12 methylthiotransferase accessory factor
VTRIARVTDLDRTGIEVACAVRPGGHVLQVTQGKGLAFREAAAGALLEAAELACAERVDMADLAWASERELCARRVPHLSPADLGGEATGEARLAWRETRDLSSGERCWRLRSRCTSRHKGARPSASRHALDVHRHGRAPFVGVRPAAALLEAVERDRAGPGAPVG